MGRSSRRLRRLVAVPALALAVAAPATADAAICRGASSSPQRLGESGVRHATLCLLNQQRRAHRLRPLRADSGLAKAALGHSKDMVAHRYFAHESRTGAAFTARMPRSRFHILGENIGWGSGRFATPRAMVQAWMHSAGHRANILQRRYRAIGIGVAFGAPVGGSGATYSTDFGG
jgi:uncharacterized protein YkwD